MTILTPQQLRKTCDPQELDRESPRRHFTNGVWIGVAQDRVRQAIRYGANSKHPGQHIVVIGAGGVATLEAIKQHIQKLAEQGYITPNKLRDYCYVYDFEDELGSQLVFLHKGYGKPFKHEMQKFLANLQKVLPTLFYREENKVRIDAIWHEFYQARDEINAQFAERLREAGLVMFITAEGAFVYKPIPEMADKVKPIGFKDNGDELLPKDQRGERTEEELELSKTILEDYTQTLGRKFIETKIKVEQEQQKILEQAVTRLFAELEQTEVISTNPSTAMRKYLDGLRAWVIENYEKVFADTDDDEHKHNSNVMKVIHFGGIDEDEESKFLPFEVNVFVDNSETVEPVVVIDENPTYESLVGEINTQVKGFGLVTDHTMIKAGSLACANGGFPLVDLDELIYKPNAYMALKKALKTRKLEIEDSAAFIGYGSLNPLKPQKLPLNLKVVMTSSRDMWRLVSHYDPEITDIFGVEAEINPTLTKTSAELAEFKEWVNNYAAENKLNTVTNEGIAKLVEYSSRLADDQEKVAIAFTDMQKILHEASYIAQNRTENRDAAISAEDVRQAIENTIFRSDLIRERILESLSDGTFIFDFEGKKVGEGYGLVVYTLPNISFGKPSRLTAKTYASDEPEFVSVTKEAKLAGKMTLMAHATIEEFLRGKFPELVFNLRSSFSFEESYYGVDGPSASLAETLVRLSSLANVPIRQDIAMTGSMDEHGRAEVIGGANEKVEGMYNAIKLTIGLGSGEDGPHGVVIPRQNVKNLMLKEEIVEAVSEGRFCVWSVSDIDEAIEIFTGMPAGTPDEKGGYPPGTFWHKVQKRIEYFAELAQERQKKLK